MKPLSIFNALQKTDTREDFIKALRNFRPDPPRPFTVITESTPFTEEHAKALNEHIGKRTKARRFGDLYRAAHARTTPDELSESGTGPQNGCF